MGVLPESIEQILNAALVCEFTVVNGRGRLVTHPMLPFYDGEKIYMTSSALFSKKLEHVRGNPKVAVSLSDQTATHGDPLAHRITVQGDATIVEDDLHNTWQRLMPLWRAKEPVIDFFYSKRVALPLFWERSIIEITPRRALLWEGGRTDRPPRVFELAGAAR